MAKTWKCRRVTKGVVCGHRNAGRLRICVNCGKKRPVKKQPAHRQVLRDLSYEDFILLNGGEFCWIHKAMGLPDPPRTRRLQRDHDHRTGKARGLLCFTCNRQLADWVTPEWLFAAKAYLDKSSS